MVSSTAQVILDGGDREVSEGSAGTDSRFSMLRADEIVAPGTQSNYTPEIADLGRNLVRFP
jgi:hypothetical protein